MFLANRWIGRFEQHAIHHGVTVVDVTRQIARNHVAGAFSNDDECKSVLLKRFGAPGVLHSTCSTHVFAALAVCVTIAERRMTLAEEAPR